MSSRFGSANGEPCCFLLLLSLGLDRVQPSHLNPPFITSTRTLHCSESNRQMAVIESPPVTRSHKLKTQVLVWIISIICFRTLTFIFICQWQRCCEKTSRKPESSLLPVGVEIGFGQSEHKDQARPIGGEFTQPLRSWVGPAWPSCTTTSPQETRREEDEDGWGGDQHRQHHPAAARGWVTSLPVLHQPHHFLLHLTSPEIVSCAAHCNRKWSADGQEIPQLKRFFLNVSSLHHSLGFEANFSSSFFNQVDLLDPRCLTFLKVDRCEVRFQTDNNSDFPCVFLNSLRTILIISLLGGCLVQFQFF